MEFPFRWNDWDRWIGKENTKRFKNNYELDKGMIKSSESIWKDIEKVSHIGEVESKMTVTSEDEVECMEKLEELHQLLGHLRALKRDGQQDNTEKLKKWRKLLQDISNSLEIKLEK